MNILIIGGGSIGKRHIKNLFSLGHTNIACKKRERSSDFEHETGAKVLVTPDEIESFNPDVIFACNPTSLHNEVLQLAVKYNCHIFMEKPLIHSKEGLEEAKQILHSYNKVFYIGFMLRFHPLVEKMKAIIDSKTLGEVYSSSFSFGSFLPYWHPWEDHTTSYASRKELGGGVINTITHELDLIQYFFGNPLKVFCSKRNFNKLGIEVEELANAIFTFSNHQSCLHLDYLQKDYDRNIKVLCEEGRVKWDWHTNQLEITKHKEETRYETLPDFDVNQLYVDELKDFFEKIKSNKHQHWLDQSHAFKNTDIMLAMHSSSEEEKVIKL